MKHKKLILWGVFIVFVLLLFLIPHQSIKATDILNTYQGFSAEHWLGTDNLGRDTFALMVTGGQRTLLCVFLATVISFTFGSLLGMIAAYEGGLVRSLVQFTADFVTVIPSLIMALIFSALFGFSAVSAGIIFGIGNMGQYINLSEGLTAGMKDRKHDFNGRLACLLIDPYGNSAPVIQDCNGIIRMDIDLDMRAGTCKSLID